MLLACHATIPLLLNRELSCQPIAYNLSNLLRFFIKAPVTRLDDFLLDVGYQTCVFRVTHQVRPAYPVPGLSDIQERHTDLLALLRLG